MDLSHVQIAGAAAALFCGGLLQSAVGFAFGLLAIPCLVWLDLPLPQAISMVLSAALVQSATGVRSLRSEIEWRTVAVGAAIRAVTILIGVLLLVQLAGLDRNLIKLVIGSALGSFVLLQWAWRVRPRDRVHPAWSVAAFSTSGLTAGLVGMGGPQLVLWAMAHRWSSEKIRAHLFAFFVTAIPFQMAVLVATFGSEVAWAMLCGALFSPVVYFGSLIGLRIGKRIDPRRLRLVAYAILMLIAVSSVIPALVELTHG